MELNDITLTIDQKVITVPEGTTILEAAGGAGIHIPTLCHHPELTPYGGCRLCVVQVDGAPRLAASCVMPVRQGMEVVTENEAIIEARRLMLEFIFAEKNHYCMFCAQSGDCELQELAYRLQMDHLTTQPMGREFPTDASHPDLVLDHNRCILCGRCVRACREVVGASILDFHNRGGEVVIGADLSGKLGESGCVSCGLCLQVCPTGAIFLRHRTHYAVRGKSRDWREKDSTCADCEMLCHISARVKKNNLINIQGCLGNGNKGPDRGQLCRRGRLDPFRNEPPRQLRPMIRQNGAWVETDLDSALSAAVRGLKRVRDDYGPSSLFGLASGAGSIGEMERFVELTGSLEFGRTDVLGGRVLRNLVEAGGKADPPPEVPWTALGEADFILQLGTLMTVSHPVIVQLILRAHQENSAVWAVIGPEKPKAPWARYVAVSMQYLAGFVEALAGEKSSVPDPPNGLDEVIRTWDKAEKPVIVAGPSLTGAADVSALKAIFKLAAGKGQNGRPPGLIFPKPGPNLVRAGEIGLASEREAVGNTCQAGLIDLCGRDDLAYVLENIGADPDFLVVMTPYVRENLFSMARVIIPRPIGLEEGGDFTTNSGPNPVNRKPVLEPPPGVESGVAVLDRLLQLSGLSPDAVGPRRP